MSPAQQAQIEVHAARFVADLICVGCPPARVRAARRWAKKDPEHAKVLKRMLRIMSLVNDALEGRA